MKRTIRAAAVLLALALSLALPVAAAPALDATALCTLTVSHRSGETPLAGAEIRLYRAADLSASGAATLAGDFADYPVSLRRLDADGWAAAANTLAVYAAADGLTPLATALTGSAGTCTFTGLPTGLYLVLVGDTQSGLTSYHTAPFLAALPNLAGEQWDYAPTVSTKVQQTTRPGGGGSTPSSTSLTVLKVWNDEDGAQRPASLQVALLRDGQSYRTVTLTAANNWRYTWTGLSSQYDWSVLETDVPEGYTVTYTGSETRFVITNTYTTDIPETPPPLDDGSPEEPLPEDLPDMPTPQAGRLPQTGLLWWPVPVLATGGLVLFALGWWRRLNGRDHEEA